MVLKKSAKGLRQQADDKAILLCLFSGKSDTKKIKQVQNLLCRKNESPLSPSYVN